MSIAGVIGKNIGTFLNGKNVGSALKDVGSKAAESAKSVAGTTAKTVANHPIETLKGGGTIIGLGTLYGVAESTVENYKEGGVAGVVAGGVAGEDAVDTVSSGTGNLGSLFSDNAVPIVGGIAGILGLSSNSMIGKVIGVAGLATAGYSLYSNGTLSKLFGEDTASTQATNEASRTTEAYVEREAVDTSAFDSVSNTGVDMDYGG